jgi:23S rRNA pseudouridine1911/1915/1917 synthase
VNGLIRHRPDLAALPRAGLVHRLDKDTSGLLVVAADTGTFKRLTRALAKREISRRYRAIAEGVMTGGRTVDAPIGRDPRNRLKQRVLDEGRPAVTRVRVLERFRAHTYLEAELETGRTHQIRVHMSAIGHPLVGDPRYGARGRLPPRPSDMLIQAIREFRRQALHAWRIAFDHPATGRHIELESELPADFARLLRVLRSDAADVA